VNNNSSLSVQMVKSYRRNNYLYVHIAQNRHVLLTKLLHLQFSDVIHVLDPLPLLMHTVYTVYWSLLCCLSLYALQVTKVDWFKKFSTCMYFTWIGEKSKMAISSHLWTILWQHFCFFFNAIEPPFYKKKIDFFVHQEQVIGYMNNPLWQWD
jgi:hypothetical protein